MDGLAESPESATWTERGGPRLSLAPSAVSVTLGSLSLT